MDKITHKVRCEQWTSIIKECLASGMPKGSIRCQALLNFKLDDSVGYRI